VYVSGVAVQEAPKRRSNFGAGPRAVHVPSSSPFCATLTLFSLTLTSSKVIISGYQLFLCAFLRIAKHRIVALSAAKTTASSIVEHSDTST
jgi:hypothetical protein